MSTSKLLNLIKQRVVVFDGAMGTSLQAFDLPLVDYQGLENCSEILTVTRPDVITEIHRSFLSVGCDAVLTNTFGANKVVLDEFDLTNRTHELNVKAVELARQACNSFSTADKPRFVIGSIGPGTKLPTLGQTTWNTLLDSYTEQARGLLDGGVDALLIETCQDILQVKSAIVAAIDARREKGIDVPIFCTVTIETTGTMLVGTDIAAAVTALRAYPEVAGIGLNCATGPVEMGEHVRFLGTHSDRILIVQPNAGLPQLVDGKPHYALTPAELAKWLREFAEADGVNIVGGCCGTTPEHLAAVVDAVTDLKPKQRSVTIEPSVSSVYQSVTLRQDTDVLAIGERTNANGSKKFRELLAAENLDGMVEMGREQANHGSHLLDVCAAYVGRDEAKDISALIPRMATDVTIPLVIDSTETEVIEAALKLAGGKSVINSMNLEDGEGKIDAICGLSRRYGSAIIALTIDEEGMARTRDRKVAIAKRIYEIATKRHGIDPADLIFDPLTFTICTGNEDDRKLALETLEAIPQIKKECPGAHTLLGVSNVSFGLQSPARKVLNSVFLHHARECGLDAAIVHVAGIMPLFKMEEEHRRIAEDLIHDKRRDEYDPLQALLAVFENVDTSTVAEVEEPKSIEEKLKRRIIDGQRGGLDVDLETAMLQYPPLTIINDILLDGMKTVGDLFGAGQMQLPFVLQSAETMKAAVRFLEPHMEKKSTKGKGTIVLATVRGDVHDIGKNLVDIILTNNGYEVINLGIKQPINNIMKAYREHEADAIGMSGLLVKSTLVMRESLGVLNEHEIDAPVILGGAALTRKYVEQDLREIYDGHLHYAKDAFEGLRTMDAIVSGQSAELIRNTLHATVKTETLATTGTQRTELISQLAKDRSTLDSGNPTDLPQSELSYTPPQSNISRSELVPRPPFWGSRIIEKIEPRALLPYLNENMLFQVQWGYRKNRRSPEEFKKYINNEVRPVLNNLITRCEEESILNMQAVYGFWPAQADGDSLIVYDSENHTERIETFDFPRMGKPPYWCLSDFFKPVGCGEMDVVAFSVVTAGREVSDVARRWYEKDEYTDYLHLHGLGVELTEALAEFIHKQVRAEWGIGDKDARNMQGIFKQHYQGSRYSFGYPACPRLEDQVKLWSLLNPERIGVSLSEEFQLEPEQTTTALITHHRQAKYFNVR